MLLAINLNVTPAANIRQNQQLSPWLPLCRCPAALLLLCCYPAAARLMPLLFEYLCGVVFWGDAICVGKIVQGIVQEIVLI